MIKDIRRQTQHHAGDPRPLRLLPGLGGPPPAPELPADAPVLFEPRDVTHALTVYETALGTTGDPLAAIREVMLFSIRVAVLNLDIR